jgi:hypothetical protein
MGVITSPKKAPPLDGFCGMFWYKLWHYSGILVQISLNMIGNSERD